MTQPVKQEGMPTPRTDAFGAQMLGPSQDPIEVWVKFSRQLERELSTALNRISELEKERGGYREMERDAARYQYVRQHPLGLHHILSISDGPMSFDVEIDRLASAPKERDELGEGRMDGDK